MTKGRRDYLRRRRQRQLIKRRAITGAACLLTGVGIAVALVSFQHVDGEPVRTEGSYETPERAVGATAGVTAEVARLQKEAIAEAEAEAENAKREAEAEEKAQKAEQNSTKAEQNSTKAEQNSTKAEQKDEKASEPEAVYTFTETEEIQLQKIGLAEMEVEGVKAIALAMRVIINREESDDFPDTIEGVIFQPGQFTPIKNGSYYDMVPNEKSKEALEMIKAGWDESQGALYFEVTTDKPTWHSRALKKLFEYKATSFYTDKEAGTD